MAKRTKAQTPPPTKTRKLHKHGFVHTLTDWVQLQIEDYQPYTEEDIPSIVESITNKLERENPTLYNRIKNIDDRLPVGEYVIGIVYFSL